jgi:nitrogenase iron protein NifH
VKCKENILVLNQKNLTKKIFVTIVIIILLWYERLLMSMRSIAFYGKGGIGKTTIACCMSILFASDGKRTLHIGCDPKHDSCYKIVPEEKLRTVMGLLQSHPEQYMPSREDAIMIGYKGIHCIESGGPEPGTGCAGRGISKTLEAITSWGILNDSNYDIVICDVLGDVVCGGFAAPLRNGFAKEVYIVVSGEVMAMYAANNICHAVVKSSKKGVMLGGMVANMRDLPRETEILESFASVLGTRLLHPIPRDKDVQRAERASQTALTFAPDSSVVHHYEALFDEITRIEPNDCKVPTPLDYHAFRRFIEEQSFE